MFEREAEEIMRQNGCRTHSGNFIQADKVCELIQEGVKLGFQLCAKSRLNITTISDSPIKDDWCYVNNKLPKKGEYIWIYTNLKNLYIARLVQENYFITISGGFVQTSTVIAWKEIEEPESPKE